MQDALQKTQKLAEAISKLGQSLYQAVEKIKVTLDRVTSKHTVFKTFSELVNAEGGYCPSLINISVPSRPNPAVEHTIAEIDFLALAYDMAQEAKGDPRRAFRS